MSKRPSVLIVEPRQNTRTFLEMTLYQEGMHVFSAVNLPSALLQLRILQPDLIILALDRLGLDDESAVARIRELSAAPVLALSEESGATVGPALSTVSDGLELACKGSHWPGIADTLPYPIKAGQLCSKVMRLLSGHRPTPVPGES